MSPDNLYTAQSGYALAAVHLAKRSRAAVLRTRSFREIELKQQPAEIAQCDQQVA